MKEMEWFIKAAEPFRGMDIKVVSETIPTHEYEVEDADQGVRGDHRHQGDPRPDPGRRRHREAADADAVGREHLRRLHQRQRPDRHPLPLRLRRAAVATSWRARARTSPCRRSTSTTSSASRSRPARTASSTSCPTSSSPTSTGSATTGSPTRTSRPSSRTSTATTSACRSTGRPTRTSPTSSPTTSRRSTARPSTATWTTARRPPTSAGASPTPGCRWPASATRACRTASRSTSGASGSRAAARSAPASAAAARPTARPPSTRCNKYMEWLRAYAPPGALGMDFYQSLPSLAKGNVAQQIFWYTAFTASMVAPQSAGNNTVDADGKPLWRMAPSPHGPYWQEGMKLGYQDAGSWTLLNSTPLDRRKAAWLYAQFTVAKTTSLKKSHVGLTIIRDSDINDRIVHRAGADARRAGRVLPQPGARRLVADRHQRAGLPEAGTALVAEHRRGRGRRGHRRHRHGQPRRPSMDKVHGAHRARRRPGRVRPEAQSREGSERVAVDGPARRTPSSRTRSRRASPSTTTR